MGKHDDKHANVKITDGSGMLIPELPTSDQAAPFPLHGPEDRPVPVNEDSPLLPLKLRDSDMQFRAVGGSNSFSAVYNLLTTVIGAGLVALPAKLKIAGLPLGIFLLVGIALLTDISIQLLLRCSRSSGYWSYADIMTAAYGKWGRGLMRFLVVVHSIGILLIYLTILGDIFSGSSSHTGILEQLVGGEYWWTSRLVILVGVAVILFPLIICFRPDALRHSAAISLLLGIIFIGGTAAVAVLTYLGGDLKLDEVKLLPDYSGWDSLIKAGTLLPTITLAFFCHQNVHPIYVELKPPRWEKMKGVARSSLILCLIGYIIISLFSYALFGSNTASDILLNYDQSVQLPFGKWISLAVRLVFAVYLLLVFPVTLDSLRSSIGATFFPKASLRDVIDQNRLKFYSLTIIILAAIVAGAVFIPTIEFAFQFTGSIASASLAFTLPAMVALSRQEEIGVEGSARSIAWFLLFFGLFITITGVASSVNKIIFYM